MRNKNLEVVLIGGIEKCEIKIVGYDPSWPENYREHQNIISTALGKAALRIEHIGSTSVPSLAAKPIIDILLVVVNSADENGYLPALQAAGYEIRVREPDEQEHRMFRTLRKDVHVHVYSANAPEIERYLIFRDRLRSNAADRQLYEQTKRRLAAQEWPHMQAYVDAKTEVIERILTAAQAG